MAIDKSRFSAKSSALRNICCFYTHSYPRGKNYIKNNSTASEEDSMLLPEALPPRACAGVLGGLNNLQKPILSPWAPGHLTQTSEGTPFCLCHESCLPSGSQLSSLLLPPNLAPAVWEEGRRSIPLQPFPSIQPFFLFIQPEEDSQGLCFIFIPGV